MTSQHTTRPNKLVWLLIALAALLVTTATAEDTTSSAGDEEQASEPAPLGLVVFVDPETGEITDQPTDEQRAALAEALQSSLSKSSAGLETFELIHGGHGVHLQGRFRSATIARMRPDGQIEIQCADHPEHAAVLLTTPPTATPEWEEK